MFRTIPTRTIPVSILAQNPATTAPVAGRFAARPLARGVAIALAVVALGACSSDNDDDPMDGTDGPDMTNPMAPGTTDPGPMNPDGSGTDPVVPPVDPVDPVDPMGGMNGSPAGSFAVVANDGMNPGSVTFYSPDLATMATVLSTGANEGIAFGPDGTLYQNADADSFTGLRAFPGAASRADMDGFGSDGAGDVQIGSQPGKGLEYAAAGDGVLVSCDVTDAGADIKLYAVDGAEDAAPVATLDLPAPCWDTFYAADDDRLYVAMTDGTLGIYDDFGDEYSDAGDVEDNDRALDRTVTPVGTDGTTKLSTNFHGVSVEGDTVLVSDVGDAASADDGLLFTFTDDDSLDGDVQSAAIGGPATMLGNPVDVVLLGGTAIVAEKSNDVILAFEGVDGLTGDVVPSYSMPFTKPESIELAPAGTGDDDTDS